MSEVVVESPIVDPDWLERNLDKVKLVPKNLRNLNVALVARRVANRGVVNWL